MLLEQVNSNAFCGRNSEANSLQFMKKSRKPLEPWQQDDAKRLKAIWESRDPKSQEKFAAEFDLSSQAMVWQYLNGYAPLNLEAAIKFAQGLNVSVDEISPLLASVLGRLPSGATQVAQDWLLLAEPIRSQWAAAIHAAADQARKMGPRADDKRVAQLLAPAPTIPAPIKKRSRVTKS